MTGWAVVEAFRRRYHRRRVRDALPSGTVFQEAESRLVRLPADRQAFALRDPGQARARHALVLPELSVKKLSKLRSRAFQRQCGLCIYCGLPMIPREAIDQFSTELTLSPQLAHEISATAEHLQARCDGGTDTEVNVAAAHLLCNARRHRMRPAPPPDKYKAIVQAQLVSGCWLKKALRQRLDAALGMHFWVTGWGSTNHGPDAAQRHVAKPKQCRREL